MSESKEVELIPFKVPCDEGHQIYIPLVCWPDSKEHLENELDKAFSVFGLIYKTAVQLKEENESGKLWYAYIAFYSKRAAAAAVLHNGKMILSDKKLRVRPTPCPRMHKQISLSLEKSQELLTYYFGFNCWTSEIVFMEREMESVEPNTIQYLCMVRVKMPKEGLSSEGIGLSKVPYDPNTPASQGLTFQCSQRFAFHAAMKAAFSKFIIITLGNSKVTVEVDTTQQDPLIYDPAWDNPLIKVNNIRYDPDDEVECEDLEDMTEEQLEELLNQSI